MAEDYKPVSDRTINDVNRANRDAWDSGEFRHGDADGWSEEASRAAAKGAPFKQAVGPLTKAQTEYGERRKKDLRSRGGTEGWSEGNPIESEHMNRRAIIARHPENDAADVVHTPEGGQRLVRGGQVVSHHDAPTSGQAAKNALQEHREAYRANYGIGSAETRSSKTAANLKHAKGKALAEMEHAKFFPGKSSPQDSHPENDAADIRHPKGGGQQVAGESGEVIVHAHDETDRAVHLPRKANRTWRKPSWS